ncbi:MAG TPA: hypothetical protein VFB66_28160 [Tepidisphaeraceae bacterium]|nr:hypothetical protein [Tepidisphaeraceae bacterium]
MGPGELEEILFEEPFRPFRVTLASGDHFVVNNQRRAMISGLSLVVGVNEDPNARTGNRLKIISIPNIVMAEHIDPRRPPNGRRGR